jgi:hypothetical protein
MSNFKIKFCPSFASSVKVADGVFYTFFWKKHFRKDLQSLGKSFNLRFYKSNFVSDTRVFWYWCQLLSRTPVRAVCLAILFFICAHDVVFPAPTSRRSSKSCTMSFCWPLQADRHVSSVGFWETLDVKMSHRKRIRSFFLSFAKCGCWVNNAVKDCVRFSCKHWSVNPLLNIVLKNLIPKNCPK